jgi:hypothetical protein
MAKWRWYEYDVWGNRKDGYEVNNVFRTSEVIDIPEIVLNSDKAIVTYLRNIGFLKKGVRTRDIEFSEITYEDTLDISYKGKPVGELRREK